MSLSKPKNGNGAKVSSSPRLTFLSHVKYEHMIAGMTGGVASTLVLHPLDLLKVRFAADDGRVSSRPQYAGLRNAVTRIIRDEGVRGLYRGVTPNCWGAGTAWGFYFLFYNSLKAYMTDGEGKTLGPTTHMLAAAEAGVLTLILTNPFWVVKTRLCLQYGSVSELASVHSSKVYTGMFDAFRKVYKYEGVPGFYKGFVPGMLGVSHGALQFMAYEFLKEKYIQRYQLPPDAKLGTAEYLGFAAMSKLFAASITYPYQVMRARLQDQYNDYTGLWDVIRKTWRNEGVTGFYKGLAPSLTRVIPATALTFVIYENVSHFLLSRKKGLLKSGQRQQEENEKKKKNQSGQEDEERQHE